MEDVQQILARNIRNARHLKGISQEELADLSGLDRTYISGIERGIRNPTIKVIAKCAYALNVSTEQLLRKK